MQEAGSPAHLPAAPASASPTPGGPPPAPAPPAAPRPTLVLIGAGHVFDIRRAIRDAVVAYQPDKVFVELDRGRLEGLLARDRGEVQERAGGFVQKRLMQFQEGVAQMYGAEVGGEMLGAVDGARAVGALVVMVDDPAEATVRQAMRQMTFAERLRLVGMVVAGGAKALVPRRKGAARKRIEGELARYQGDPAGVLAEMADKFPTIHRVLIAERDAVMAKRIRKAMASAQVGVAVLGDGHVEGMRALLADLAPVVYRLADVRDGRLPRRLVATGTAERIGFSVRAKGA